MPQEWDDGQPLFMRKMDLLKSYPAAMQQKGEVYIDLVTGGSHGSREAGNFILYVATQLHYFTEL